MQIDAVEQGAGNARLVIGAAFGGTAAGLGWIGEIGPVQRASDRGAVQHRSRSIGLWRDQTGDTKELILAEGASGILLSLSGQRVTERTTDGRTDSAAARVWIFADQMSVKLKEPPKWAT
jgi:hypothetical protein